jgi:hypothetical protein
MKERLIELAGAMLAACALASVVAVVASVIGAFQ